MPTEYSENGDTGVKIARDVTEGLSLAWRHWGELAAAELYELLQFRQAIFVVEQASPYPDLDGRDSEARHLTLRQDGALIGYLRLIAPNAADPRPVVRIGRVSVALEARGHGHARRLMDEALRVAAELHPETDIEIGAQTHLEAFYRSLGFTPSSSPYDDFGVPHIDLILHRASAA